MLIQYEMSKNLKKNIFEQEMIICLLIEEDVVMFQFAAGLLIHSALKKSKFCKNFNITIKNNIKTLYNILWHVLLHKNSKS